MKKNDLEGVPYFFSGRLHSHRLTQVKPSPSQNKKVVVKSDDDDESRVNGKGAGGHPELGGVPPSSLFFPPSRKTSQENDIHRHAEGVSLLAS